MPSQSLDLEPPRAQTMNDTQSAIEDARRNCFHLTLVGIDSLECKGLVFRPLSASACTS